MPRSQQRCIDAQPGAQHMELHMSGSPGMQPREGPGAKGWNKEFFWSLLKKEQLPASFLPSLWSPLQMTQLPN